MLYSEVRDDIKNGDLLAFRGTALFSRLIKAWTHSRTSHVGIACWMHGRLTVIEAMEGVGVRVYPMSMRLGKVDWYELLPEYRVDRRKSVEYALDQWGKRYASPWQFVRSWGKLTAWAASRRGLDPDTNEDRFFCSELVMCALQAGGYRGEGYTKSASQTDPGDCVELPCFHRMGRLTG